MKKAQLKEKLGFDTYKGISICSKKFDCDWKKLRGLDKSIAPNACEKCYVCKYLNFLDWAGNLGTGTIEYVKELDKYIEIFKKKVA